MDYAIRNNLPEIERLAEAVEEFGEAHDISPKIIFAINLSLDELITNTINYGYNDTEEHQIQVKLSLNEREIEIELKDDGMEFNPLLLPVPDTNKPLEERPIGGLGIHLVRNAMDQIEYKRQGDTNILLMKKQLINE